MAEITEVPICTGDVTEVSEAPVEEVFMTPLPKSRGSPRGSLNKPKAAPKAAPKKRAQRARPAPLVESGGSTPEPPSPPIVRRPWSRAASSESVQLEAPPPTAQDIAAQVLYLLSNRRNDQTVARREKYKGWCEQ